MGRHKKVGRKPLPPKKLKKNIAEQQAAYAKENTKSYSFRFMLKTDSDVIEQLEKQDNKSGYVKTLIREDMKKSGE